MILTSTEIGVLFRPMNLPPRVRRFSGSKLKEARKAIGISRETLAKAVGCDKMSIYNWETGASFPNVKMFAELVAWLEKPEGFFFE